MRTPLHLLDRRAFLSSAGGFALAAGLSPRHVLAASPQVITRAIPSTGEQIPAVGMGTWITFNVGSSAKLRDRRVDVLKTFFDLGGAMVDSSPMYGSSEEVVGYCLERLDNDQKLFSATKVWTVSEARGIAQMEDSERFWKAGPLDLMQVHNLLDWETHLKTLAEWKAAKRIRYIGITTSHGRRHEDFEAVMTSQPVDFVQFTYNMIDREAEQRLLPAAADRGLAVIINRPFRRGDLFDKFADHPLPEWASEFGAANWAQFFLKFVISHPSVTCAIPATSRVEHMTQNMGAANGPLPDRAMRKRMVQYVESL